MPTRIRISLIMAFTALLLFWAAGFVAFAVHVRGIPEPDNDSTEAIIVLTGGAERINTGLDLLADKKAEYLFISGVNTKVSVSELISLWRKDEPSPPCCIILGHEAQNTFENATEAGDWMQANNIRSARILTADYHMPRTWLVFNAQLPQTELHPHPIRPKNASWLLMANEYNKTLYTLLRLKLSPNLT